MKYFIFAMFFILWAPASSAQDFFVPGNAFSSAADKLKPIPRDRANYNQRRYKVIDGRVIALPDEVTPDEENIELQQPETDMLPLAQTTQAEKEIPMPEPKVEPEAQKDVVAVNTPEPAPVTLHEPAFLKPRPQLEEEDDDDEDEEESIMFQAEAPVVQDFDSNLPIYKNRYTLYVNDLKTFQKTNKLPKNKDLEDTLKKLSHAREVTLFEGEVQ